MAGKKQGVYKRVIVEIFQSRYKKGDIEVAFGRDELTSAAQKLQLKVPKNLGDMPYSFRFRDNFPSEISETAPKGKTWTIELDGKARYKFSLWDNSIARLIPRKDMQVIKIPDSTPEIVACHRFSDEQALLAILRYNRLIDIFLGITAHSLQNHLRTTVVALNSSQIEIDEIYIGVDSEGKRYIVPVQAKGGTDQLAGPQIKQDLLWAAERFPEMQCHAVCAQFIDGGVIALFKLDQTGGRLTVLDEKHYSLDREVGKVKPAGKVKTPRKLRNG